jgi:signal transduction histidine kinase
MRGFFVRYPHACVVVLILATMLIYVGGVRYYAEEAKKQAAYDKARALLESILSLHQYYSKSIVPRIKASGGTFDMHFQDNPASFPFPGAVSIDFGNALRDVNPNMDTKIFSNYPFPIRKDRTLDQFEIDALVFLKNNPDQGFTRFEIRNGIETVRYAIAMHMRKDCVECHNRPAFQFQGKWKVGDFRGARQVTLPVPDVTPIIDEATVTAVIVAIVAAMLGGLLVLPVVSSLNRSLLETGDLAVERERLVETLDQKNATLESEMRSKAQLIAGLSHDLRSPVNAIIGFSSMLRDHLVDPNDLDKRTDYATYINDSGRHLQGLIEQILEVSTVEAGTWHPQDTDVDLGLLMGSIRPILEAASSSTNLKLEIRFPPDLPTLRADERAITRLLTNLVDNAARYSEGTTIFVEAFSNVSGGISVTVTDDGSGIDPDKLEEMRQLGSTSAGVNDLSRDSMGLGLWLVDLLMAAHGGKATYENSGPNGGLRATLVFSRERSLSGESI